MRPLGIAAFWLSLAALVGTQVLGGSARAGLGLQEGTPAATTPVAPTAATNVVTLVAWYANDPSGQFLNVFPLALDQGTVAGPAPGAAPIGRADFPDPAEGLPTITIGDTAFEAYLRYEGDVAERWTWFNDEENNRPATLVLQVAGTNGAYQNYFGTATFVSRAEGAGGVLVLALIPPEPGAAAAAATEPAAAEVPAADTPSAEVPEVVVATEEPPTDVVSEEAPPEETPAI